MDFCAWLIVVIVPVIITGVSVLYYMLGGDDNDDVKD